MEHPQPVRVSIEDYIASEIDGNQRHEYIAGEIFAMTGASDRHNLIAGNLHAWLHSRLRGGPCRVYISDMKLRIEAADALYYPDLLVTCDPADRGEHYKERACLVVEVLSPSTAGTDRREKLFAYRQLPSLREYLLVDQDRRAAWIYRRAHSDRSGSDWLLIKHEGDDELQLESIGVTLPLDEIYDRIELPSPADLREEEELYSLQ